MNPACVSESPKTVYVPEFRETQLVRFTKFVEHEHKLKFNDYWELQEWSVKHYPKFWDCLWRFYDLKYSQPYSQVCEEGDSIQSAKWFPGVRMNYAENVLRYRDSHTALIALDVDRDAEYITYQQLYEEVRVYARALRDAGLKKGDFVACTMTHKKEAIYAYLATTSIGASWGAAMPQLGALGILTRLQYIQPKFLFSCGNFFLKETEIKMNEKLQEIVAGLPSLEKVIFVQTSRKGKVDDISGIPKCVLLRDFLCDARTVGGDLEFEQVPFDHTVCVSFTSGTTGFPKALMHTNGFLVTSMKDYGLSEDLSREDVICTITPNGWNIWNLNVNTLRLGVTLLLYEGEPFLESPTCFWDLVDEHGITSTFIRCIHMDEMEQRDYVPTSKHSLKSLRQMFPVGSAARPEGMEFLTQKIKPGLFCSPIYGASEVYGFFNGLDHNLPVYKGEIQLVSLAMDMRVLDKNDQLVIGKSGNLVLANPYPALPTGIVNDPEKKLLTKIYLTEHPGFWNTGDSACINPITKGLTVFGRSDESIPTVGGKIWSLEVESTLVGFEGIIDSVYVLHSSPKRGKRIVLFVKMEPGARLLPKLEEDIRQRIVINLTVFYLPQLILQTPDIPYNLTGKKLNNIVKKIIHKEAVTSAENIINPASLKYFETLDLYNM